MLETAFTMDTSSIKYGPGVTREVGHDMRQMGGRRVMVVTDPGLSGSEPITVTLDALRDAGVDATLFDQARVEPTDASLKDAVRFAVRTRSATCWRERSSRSCERPACRMALRPSGTDQRTSTSWSPAHCHSTRSPNSHRDSRVQRTCASCSWSR